MLPCQGEKQTNNADLVLLEDFYLIQSAEVLHDYQYGQCKTQTADCRPGVKCRLRVKCRLQTAD